LSWFTKYVTSDQLKEAMDSIHDALRHHDSRVDTMDGDNKRALEQIRATQIKIGLMVIGGLVFALWETIRPALHFKD
jgi:hypothetical protein